MTVKKLLGETEVVTISSLHPSEEGARISVPVWTPPHGHWGNHELHAYSRKLGRNVTFYSTLEYDNWLLVEADPGIIWFCEQPLKATVDLDGKRVTTYFDLFIKRTDGSTELQEIKPDLEDDEKLTRQLQAQEKWVSLHRVEYRLREASDIRAEPEYLKNCQRLNGYLSERWVRASQFLVGKVLEFVRSEPCSIKDLCRQFRIHDQSLVMSALAILIHDGSIEANALHNAFISSETRIEYRATI